MSSWQFSVLVRTHREAEEFPRRINYLCDFFLFEGMRKQLSEVDASLVKGVRGLV